MEGLVQSALLVLRKSAFILYTGAVFFRCGGTESAWVVTKSASKIKIDDLFHSNPTTNGQPQYKLR